MAEVFYFMIITAVVDVAGMERNVTHILVFSALWAAVGYLNMQIMYYLAYQKRSHNLIVSAFKSTESPSAGSHARLFNFSRFIRSQMYCIFATTVGLYLLMTHYRHLPDDLLNRWSKWHETIFEIAISHWLVCIVEDHMVSTEVISHMIIPPDNHSNIFTTFSNNLLMHHMITIFAFGWSIGTQKLSGLCVFGLVFELPVLIMNVRDFVACFGDVLDCPWKKVSHAQFKIYVTTLALLWHLARTGPCLLYPISLLFWRTNLAKLSLSSQIVYHLLGLIFIYVNMSIVTIWIPRYHKEDLLRMGMISEAQFYASVESSRVRINVTQPPTSGSQNNNSDTIAGGSSELRPTVSHIIDRNTKSKVVCIRSEEQWREGINTDDRSSKTVNALHDLESGTTTQSASTVTADCTTSSCPESRRHLGLRLLGAREVAAHAAAGGTHNSHNAVWVTISGGVYDVSAFVEEHPGGSAVLRAVAGTDATDQFLAVGHSAAARTKMESFLIGKILPGGYSQQFSGEPSSLLESVSNAELEQRKSDQRRLAMLRAPYKALRDYSFFANEGRYTTLCGVFVLAVVLLAAGLRDAAKNGWDGSSGGNSGNSGSGVSIIAANLNNGASSSDIGTISSEHHSAALFHARSVYSSWSLVNTVLQHLSCIYLLGILAAGLNYWLITEGIKISSSGESFLPSNLRVSSSCRSMATAFKALLLNKDSYKPLLQWKIQVAAVAQLVSVGSDIGMLSLVVAASHADALHAMRLSVLLTLSGEAALRASSSSATTARSSSLVGKLGWSRTFLVLLLAVICEGYTFVSSANTVTQMLQTSSVALPIISAVSRMIHLRMLSEQYVYTGAIAQTYTHSSFMFVVGFFYIIFISVFICPFAKLQEDGLSYFTPHFFVLNYFDSTLLIAYICWYAFLLFVGISVRWSSPSFMTQSVALWTLLMLHLITPVSGYWMEWFGIALTLLALVFLSKESAITLKTGSDTAPRYLYIGKQLEDDSRQLLSVILVKLIVQPLVNLASLLAPAGFMYYMFPLMVHDLGDKCDVGIAYQVNGTNQEKPAIFQFNVGYLNSMEDLITTTTATKEMLQEIIDDPDIGKKGFVSDVVVTFPLSKKSQTDRNINYNTRELNLSAWTSANAAHNWYKNSKAHKEIVRQYYGGDLCDFGSMLAQLAPDKPIRWEVRCRACKKMVHGPIAEVCPYCGAAISSLPFL